MRDYGLQSVSHVMVAGDWFPVLSRFGTEAVLIELPQGYAGPQLPTFPGHTKAGGSVAQVSVVGKPLRRYSSKGGISR